MNVIRTPQGFAALSLGLALSVVTAREAEAQAAPGAVGTTAGQHEDKTVGIFAWFRGSSNLYAPSTADHRSSLAATLLADYRLGDRWLFRGTFAFAQSLTGDRDFLFQNPELRLFYALPPLGEHLRVSFGPVLTLPGNRQAIDRDSFRFAGGAAGRVSFVFPEVLQGLGGFYEVALSRYFHEFRTGRSGESNPEWNLDHAVVANLEFVKDWSFFVTGGFSSRWTYAGSIGNVYSLSQEIDYAVTETVTVGLGHSIARDFLNSAGDGYRVGFIDAGASRLYLSLQLRL